MDRDRTDDEQAIRRVLDLPSDAKFIQQRLEQLGRFDTRLAGLAWDLTGCLVEPTRGRVDYPVLRFGRRGELPRQQLQIWMCVISQPPNPLFSQFRWHPAQGLSLGIGGFTEHDGQETVLRAWEWLRVTLQVQRRGRRRGTRKINDHKLLEVALNLIRLCDCKEVEPTQIRVATWLRPRFDPVGDQNARHVARYLQRWAKRLGFADWEAVVRLARTST